MWNQGPNPKMKVKSAIGSKVASNYDENLFTADILSKISISKNVCDNCCFLIICPVHHQILLRKTCTFFPCVPMNHMKTWYESGLDACLTLLISTTTSTGDPDSVPNLEQIKENLPFRKFVCMHILRFQLPHNQRFVTRLIYLAELDPGRNSGLPCCTGNNNYRWWPMQEAISSKIDKVWGPEVSYFTNIASYNRPIAINVVEYSITDAFKYVPRESPITYEDQMLISTGVSLNDIERLYADFIEHCYPSFFLTRFSFKVFLQKHQIETDTKKINRYYSAFRFRGKQYMQFHELLLGLTAIDKRAPHDEFRIRMIFRFYDYDKDDHLSVSEFKRLLLDLGKGPVTNIQVKTAMKKVGVIVLNNNEVVSYESFKQAIDKNTFRGTINLCRATLSPFGQITRSLATMKLCTTVSNKKLKKIILQTRYQGICQSCKRKNYELSPDLIVLDRRGCMKEIIHMTNNKTPEKHSLLHFLMKEIQVFNKIKDNQKTFRGIFGNLTRGELQAFSEDFKMICTEVSAILEKEDRVLKIEDPVYVIGDIHGNLEDLLTLEQTLWKSFPLLTANYLFLGDYVDRGKWGFECFLYLMILKFISPKRIFLLRGNHEIRHIQRKYSFHKELYKKYGSLFGELYFNLINEVFDRLPFSAVINKSIYCAHGGLPYSDQNLDMINTNVPRVLRDPESEACTVWETVWSDPLEYSKFGETSRMLGLPINCLNGLFLPNIKRGTSYFFNEFAVIAFFKLNNLDFMVRAHEVPASGFKFNFGTLCTTVFSCSHYCGADNECAVVFLDRENRIRLIRIDTTLNNPGT